MCVRNKSQHHFTSTVVWQNSDANSWKRVIFEKEYSEYFWRQIFWNFLKFSETHTVQEGWALEKNWATTVRNLILRVGSQMKYRRVRIYEYQPSFASTAKTIQCGLAKKQTKTWSFTAEFLDFLDSLDFVDYLETSKRGLGTENGIPHRIRILRVGPQVLQSTCQYERQLSIASGLKIVRCEVTEWRTRRWVGVSRQIFTADFIVDFHGRSTHQGPFVAFALSRNMPISLIGRNRALTIADFIFKQIAYLDDALCTK